jgi:hypothetical protein
MERRCWKYRDCVLTLNTTDAQLAVLRRDLRFDAGLQLTVTQKEPPLLLL